MAFVKITSKTLTGAQKAAVLFMLIGDEALQLVSQNLTAEELRKVQGAVKSLRYGQSEEMSVLEEVASYGKQRGIWKEVQKTAKRADNNRDAPDRDVSDIRSAAAKDPEEVAKLIAAWVGKGDSGEA